MHVTFAATNALFLNIIALTPEAPEMQFIFAIFAMWEHHDIG